MIELIIIMFVVAIFGGLSRWATDQRFKRKYKEKLTQQRKHDLHYNSLDPRSPYLEKECCGNACGCHTEEKQVDMKSSGDM